MAVTYKKTNDPDMPAVIMANGRETPVWLQAFWKTGPDVYYIHWNGCGHCCTAMAARLQGVKDIDPAKEYARCKELWGEPTGDQDHFQTVLGIEKILKSFGVKAEALGAPSDPWELKGRLEKELHAGKQVIFWSHPIEGKETENPFSAGEHYVMACGYDKAGNIVIANSGKQTTPAGVQTVDMDTVLKALYAGAIPEVETWGEVERLEGCAGIVIVG